MRKIRFATNVATLCALTSVLIVRSSIIGQCSAQTVEHGSLVSVKPGSPPTAANSLHQDMALPGSRLYSQFAPYYTVTNDFMTMLMLNNATRTELSVEVVLYTLDG